MLIGLDPGATGAFALLTNNGGLIETYDMPTTKEQTSKKGKKKTCINYPRLVELVRELRTLPINHVFIEKVGARPGEGVVSSHSFGETYGAGKLACHFFDAEIHMVRPAVWKKHFGLIGTEKDAARLKAIELFGSDKFKRKKDGGRADASLIAMYGVSICQ